jgi:anti-sigma B factor antagonist
MSLNIQKREVEPGTVVVEISGRIALGRESRKIEPEVADAIESGARKIILDLSGVTHIDSTGIGIMAYCFGKATQGGAELRISGAKESVFSVFQITRLVHAVPFYPDVDSALKGNGRIV